MNWQDKVFHLLTEVAPPGWGHTVAKKEKTKPKKPKSKIGGTIQAMKKAKAEGRMPGVKNIFALAWSMKNKGAKPHYKPGVRGKKKKKYARVHEESVRDRLMSLFNITKLDMKKRRESKKKDPLEGVPVHKPPTIKSGPWKTKPK